MRWVFAKDMDRQSLVYSPIGLPGGWNGVVLTECRDATLCSGAALRPPTIGRWREWLSVLVSDSRRLPGCKTLKCSNSAEVLRAEVPGGTDANGGAFRVVCKRTGPSGIVQAALAPFRATRARRNYHWAQRLLDAGIGTAIPLACLERRSSPRAAWLVSEYLAGVIDLDHFVLALLPRLDRSSARAAKNATTHAIAEFLARLYRAGLHHRDLKASNVLVANWHKPDASPRVHIVDLDGLSTPAPWQFGRRWRPLIRVAAGLVAYPAVSRADYARCLREYLAFCGDDPAAWRRHYSRLAESAASYARRSQGRKTAKLDGFSGD